ncbi:heme lyase CcmF/NrfE family subunit [Paraferrimonas haliotis]|uniref:Heme lyase CcmF/NrfE family subunit n=1 Tax=Paraferrimonas haliotis TaxID=2013866 RepID=A0AA37TKI2_9GAMM|nr:heme lyase NrfEFG subunit NrfE [Paraferrimonas haliotis]GLS82228.1 heme lyase CcmF/NrfE family subunit [Paraferrimonas haliotis]
MFPELGLYLLAIANVSAVLLFGVPWLGRIKKAEQLKSYSKPLLRICAVSLVIASIILVNAFLGDDFSVSYVADHSNTHLASLYKVAAFWGGHEGSMLFWVLAMSLWGLTVRQKENITQEFVDNYRMFLGLVLAGFSTFLLFTSNPFARNLPDIPTQGRDLNPILQDIGLVIHPPLLFLGYVGLAIVFALALATLLKQRVEQSDIKLIRHHSIIAWVLLTGGNVVGSWWAYNELGWGGWWFWDPVENASFIPWLVATALVHQCTVSRRQQTHKFTMILALSGFLLALLGTFTVRSGIVQSVHAFAVDPERGLLLLGLLGIFLAIAVFQYLRAAPLLSSAAQKLSQQSKLLVLGNFVIIVGAFSVILGTYYPIIYQLFSGQSISVGPPYFNTIFVPIVVLSVVVLGIALNYRYPKLWASMLGASVLVAAGVTAYNDTLNGWLFAGVLASSYLIASIIAMLIMAAKTNKLSSLTQKSGAIIAHLGLAVAIIGATAVSNFEEDEVMRMGPGQGREIGNYIFVYEATTNVETNSYKAIQANIQVMDIDENLLGYLYPQRQTFKSNAIERTAAGTNWGLSRDIYASMGGQLSESEYLIRISIKPFVSFLWLGGGLIMIGGLLSITLGHRRTKRC